MACFSLDLCAAQIEFLTNISPDTRIPEERTVKALVSTASDLKQQLCRQCKAVHMSSPLDWQRAGVYEAVREQSDVLVGHRFTKKNVRLVGIMSGDDTFVIENNFSEHRAVLHVLQRPFRQPLSLLYFTGAMTQMTESESRPTEEASPQVPKSDNKDEAGTDDVMTTPSSAQFSWTPTMPASSEGRQTGKPLKIPTSWE